MNPQQWEMRPDKMHFNAEHAKNAEKHGGKTLCESLRFSVFSAFKKLNGLSKTIQTIEAKQKTPPDTVVARHPSPVTRHSP